MTVIHFLKQNGRHEPPLVVMSNNLSRALYGHEVEIKGPSQIVYAPNAPLECGSKVWIKTDSPVEVWIME